MEVEKWQGFEGLRRKTKNSNLCYAFSKLIFTFSFIKKGKMHLDHIAPNKYLYNIENDIEYAHLNEYSFAHLSQEEEKSIIKFHNNFNGTFDIYAYVENDCRYVLNVNGLKTHFAIEDGKILKY